MKRAFMLAALALLAACGEKAPPSGPGPAPEPAPAPADAAADVATCAADEGHCCMPDGTVVVPGGCQPHFPEGVQPNVERADDGTCREIPCQLRCLPAEARIATPRGDVAVSALRPGDPIWTVDAAGARVEGRVVRVASLPVVAAHAIVEHTLADGRVVRASAGHPDAAGGTVGALVVGAALDGSTITATRVVPYTGTHTWDVLPDGPTGRYWSDGVLLGSTLR
jgi:hypothetical protein